MVRATHSRCYAAAFTMDEEARRHQGHGIMAASPPARAVIVVQSEVEDHSAHQRRDRNGRFVATDGTNNARSRGRRTMMNRKRMVPVVPNVQVSIDLGFGPCTVAIDNQQQEAGDPSWGCLINSQD